MVVPSFGLVGHVVEEEDTCAVQCCGRNISRRINILCVRERKKAAAV